METITQNCRVPIAICAIASFGQS